MDIRRRQFAPAEDVHEEPENVAFSALISRAREVFTASRIRLCRVMIGYPGRSSSFLVDATADEPYEGRLKLGAIVMPGGGEIEIPVLIADVMKLGDGTAYSDEGASEVLRMIDGIKSGSVDEMCVIALTQARAFQNGLHRSHF